MKTKDLSADTAVAVAKAYPESQELEELFIVLSAVTLEGVVLSEGGVILDVNDQLCDLLGYRKDELVGTQLALLIYGSKMRDQVMRPLLDGVENLAECTLLCKDGSLVPVEVHGRNASWRNRAMRITSIRDISSRVEKERALRKERETLALFVEHAPVALAMFDREMRYVCLSRRWIDLFELGRGDLKGVSHYEAFPDLKEKWKKAHRRGLAGETVSAAGEPFERRDGKVLWVNWEIQPWHQGDGSVGGIIIFAEDVTHQRLYEEQLRELTQRLSYHMENSPLAVIEWGPDMRVIRWAGAAERIFGWRAEEVLGKRIEDLRWVYEEDQGQVAEVISDLTSGAKATRFLANRNYRRDGTVAFCEWYSSSLLHASGGLRSILSLALDVTERKNLEDSLARYSENLEQLVRERTDELVQKNQLLFHQSRLAALGEMINTIAHQWRQPLNILGLHIQNLPYLCKSGQELDCQEFTGQCMKLIEHMSATIEDFRDFFRPDREKTHFAINAALKKAIGLVKSGYQLNNIQVEINLTSDSTAIGYSNHFAQAVLCLLQNARDAFIERGVENGRVVAASFVEEDRAVVTIADNAGGIPGEIQHQIFDPYFSTKGEAGTGIGLFMTRTIIESMGGSVSVRNVDNGAEFRIELPVTTGPSGTDLGS
ncbi:MAG TPA: PAS domain-containing sensor histidine kinase [Geomonas sp.]|nr:PAS domain-containing sensor histidine kinase [Geomonas sp.]